MEIHPTAVVHPKANLAAGVVIGPYSIIGEGVTLAENVRIENHCVLTGNTHVGRNCHFFSGAVIGSSPQDKKYIGEKDVFLSIGENNVFREYTTANHGTGEGGQTVIGHNNLFMAYAHVAHDCLVGNGCVLANSATLAGHVTLEDQVVIGGLTAIHQFVRLGRLAIVGGCSKVVQDIPPFSTCDGHPARVYGINSVGLKRSGLSSDTVHELHKAFRILFHSKLSRTTAFERIAVELKNHPEIQHLVHFIQSSKRGVCS